MKCTIALFLAELIVLVYWSVPASRFARHRPSGTRSGPRWRPITVAAED